MEQEGLAIRFFCIKEDTNEIEIRPFADLN
jgi:hypothetical protein